MSGSSYIAITIRLHRRAAFSLVEMLAVMGIIVLLLAATLPAMRGLNQSESRRGAVGNLMATLDRARMLAISDGLNTYVVFASKTPVDPQINADMWGRAYAIFEDNDNISFIPVQKTPWLYLPKGLAFKVTDVINTASISAPSPAPAESVLTCYTTPALPPQTSDPAFPMNPAVGNGSVKLPYWKFDGTGVATVPASIQTPARPADYLKLLIFPGYINASGSEISTQNMSGAGNQQVPQLEEIDVNPVTGRAKYIIDPTNNLLSTPSSTPQS